MAIITTLTLDCDRCGWEYDASSPYPSATKLRSWAKADGWKVGPGGIDLCRKCAQEDDNG